jgi:hypothetical protein
MKPDFVSVDGGELQRFYWDDLTLHRVHSSLTEDRIMRENRELEGRTLEWCRPVLRMSFAQYEMLQRIFPDFKPGGDHVARRRVIEKIASDPDFRALVIGKA